MLVKSPIDIDTYLVLHSEFTNYCEALILPDGTICDCIPSHIETLIRITSEDRQTIADKMPMSAAPINWLICYTNCIAIWFDYIMFHDKTDAQIETLKKLYETNTISKNTTCVWTNEKEHCEKLQNYKQGDTISPSNKCITFKELIT